MMRFLLLLGAAGVALNSYAFGDTRTYEVGAFTGLDASRVIDVIYTQGPEVSVIADIPDGDFEELKVRVDSGVLTLTRPTRGRGYNTRITENDGVREVRINGRVVPVITVYVTAPAVSSFELSSSSTLEGSNINISDLRTEVSSSSRITLTGQCGTLRHDSGSSSTFDGKGLSCSSADINAGSSSRSVIGTLSAGVKVDASSSADVTVTLTGGDVDVDASSSADVVLNGTCDTLMADTSSGADLNARSLACKRIDAEASSGGDIWVRAAEYVSAKARSGADIEIFGQPGTLQKSELLGGDITVNAAL